MSQFEFLRMMVVTLSVVVLIGSVFQSATGMGFGVIVSPILLLMVGKISALEISVVLSLLVSTLASVFSWRNAHLRLLLWLLIGSSIGLLPGILLLSVANEVILKGLAGLFIIAMCLRLSNESDSLELHQRHEAHVLRWSLFAGILSGVLNGILAMPGPVPSAWMVSNGFHKESVRGTILCLLPVSYSLALASQLYFLGIGRQTFWITGLLIPVALAGIPLGTIIARKLSQRMFRTLLLILLSLTGTTLLVDVGLSFLN